MRPLAMRDLMRNLLLRMTDKSMNLSLQNPLARALMAATALALAAPMPAAADGFSTTNIELLQGHTFDDRKLGYHTVSGNMTTTTLNTFSTWEYGDSFAFVDLYTGDFSAGNGFPGKPGATAYAEWHPRLLVNKLLGQTGDTLGIFRNWGLAAELNQGSGFYAYLLGLGVDFAVPIHHGNVSLNVYYRYDRFDYHVWQISPYWNIPFSLGPVPFLFAGFVDIAGSKDIDHNSAVDIMAQPQLLVDVLAPFGGKANRLYVGCEWYIHKYPSGFYGGAPRDAHTTSAPQAMVQWTIF